MTPPRLHVVPAAAVAVVIRRGPSKWWHVLRWQLDPPRIEPGAWFRGQLYPRRCDVSADGALLGYYALTGKPPPWDSYLAVSKAPWLHALAMWHQGSTWHWGCEFLADGRFCTGAARPDPPTSGTYPAGLAPRSPLPALEHPDRWRLRDVQREARRGWVQHKLADDDALFRIVQLPDRLPLVLRRPRPGDDRTALVLAHAGHDYARHGIEGAEIHYVLDRECELAALPDVAWADWTADGRLLVAATDGALRIESLTSAGLDTEWRHDLAELQPAPRRAPAWALHW
jgi:hypothetical protein